MINRKDIVAVTSEIVAEECPEELDIFLSVSEALYDEIANNTDISQVGNSSFGDASDVLSTILMVVVTTVAIEMSKEGVKFTKYALKNWINSRYDNISNKIKHERWKLAVNIIKKYLDE